MMTLLDYHRIRDAHIKARNLRVIQEAVRAQDPNFPGRVMRLLQEPLPRPAERDRFSLAPALVQLCELYLSATPQQRELIRSMIDKHQGGRLQGFGYCAANLGLRQKSERTIRLGLVAHAVEDLATGDVRDTLCLLTLLFDAAKRVGSDPSVLFCEVAAISGPAMSAVLLDYLERQPELQTLKCIGFREVETPEGVEYRQARVIFRKTRRR